MVDQLNELREGCLEAYNGILVALKGDGASRLFIPHFISSFLVLFILMLMLVSLLSFFLSWPFLLFFQSIGSE